MVFGGIAEDRTTNRGFLSDHDTFTRSDPAAPRGFPLARHPGVFPRRTPSDRPGVSRARSCGSAARAGPGPGAPGVASGSGPARGLRGQGLRGQTELEVTSGGSLGGPCGQTEFQVNLKLGLTPRKADPAKPPRFPPSITRRD